MKAYDFICKKEISYRDGKELDVSLVANDTINTTLMIARGYRNVKLLSDEEFNQFQLIDEQIKPFRNFLVGTVNREDIVLASAKAGYLTSAYSKSQSISWFTNDMDENDFLFKDGDYIQLNRMSKLGMGIMFYLKNMVDFSLIKE